MSTQLKTLSVYVLADDWLVFQRAHQARQHWLETKAGSQHAADALLGYLRALRKIGPCLAYLANQKALILADKAKLQSINMLSDDLPKFQRANETYQHWLSKVGTAHEEQAADAYHEALRDIGPCLPYLATPVAPEQAA